MTLDKTLMKMDDMYTNAENVFNEISLFSAEHLLRKSATISSSFNYICKWLSTNIDQDSFSIEYNSFSKNFKNFIITCPEISENIDNNTTIDEFSHENNSSDNDSLRSNDEDTNALKLLDIFKTLSNTGMSAAFPNLYLAYKDISTLPPTSASAERCFSKLKLIKTNLRSTMSESRLDHLMLISCNADIDIPIDEAINMYGSWSKLLQSALLFS